MPNAVRTSTTPLEPLALPADLTAFRGEAVDEAQALVALASASGVVRGYCGWRLDQAEDTFIARGGSSQVLFLPTLTVAAVASVDVDGTALLLTDDYAWTANGMLYAPSWAGDVVTVVATHGYDPLPDEIKGVVLAVAARAVTTPNSETRESAGAWAGAYAGSGLQLLDSERQTLDAHRLEQG